MSTERPFLVVKDVSFSKSNRAESEVMDRKTCTFQSPEEELEDSEPDNLDSGLDSSLFLPFSKIWASSMLFSSEAAGTASRIKFGASTFWISSLVLSGLSFPHLKE